MACHQAKGRRVTASELMPLSALYRRDETAWLDIMSSLAANGHAAEMDFANLSEYLADMANRDRREVSSRLVGLLAHLLKWEYQPDHRSGCWRRTILEQRRELHKLLECGSLHNHALAVLAECYSDARKEAGAETGLSRDTFPHECPWELDSLLADDDA
jgi:hypothetical protein